MLFRIETWGRIAALTAAASAGVLLLLSCATLSANAADSPKTRLFILSGQSNMKHVDPEESFRPALKAAFPQDDIIIVKVAMSGEPIRRWYKKWKSESGEAKPGLPVADIYKMLMKEVDNATSGKPVPDTITFVWMQGEADTSTMDGANAYEKNLKGLILQVRDDLKRPDTFVVIGRISDYAKNPEESKIVRNAEMTVADSDPLARWVDTDDLNGKRNDLHYTKEGYKILGERFAAKAIELIRKPAH